MTPGSGPIEIIAHRGFSAAAPENTLAALEAAAESGAPAVEFDVQVASCGTPVLFHDVHLGRTTNGVGPVRRRTLAQLQALDAGSWFDADFAGERIPSLAEALEGIGTRFDRIYCEIKGYREMEDLDRIVSVSRESGHLERIVFISLDWLTLERVASQAPDLPIGFVVDEADRVEEAVERALRHGNAFVDAGIELLLDGDGHAGAVLDAGLDLGVWTVDQAEVAAELHALGVTRFTTNQVASLLEWRTTL